MAQLSIIVPAYNAADSLKRCIESVISQSFNDWTLTVVDDGSSDSSSAIVSSYAHDDERIRLIPQDNQGPLASRLNGVNASDSEWVLFVDADDSLASADALERMMAEASHNPDAEIIVGADNRNLHDFGVVNLRNSLTSPADYALAMLRGEVRHEMWGTLFRRSFLKDVVQNSDLQIDGIDLRYGEDFVFMLRVLAAAKMPLRFVDGAPVYAYNPNCKENDVWNRASFEEIKIFLDFLKDSTALFKENVAIRHEWARYALRFIYKYAIARNLDFSSSEPIVHDILCVGEFYGHDCKLAAMLRHKSVRRLVAKRHHAASPAEAENDVAAVPEISVLIPAYNAEMTIVRAIMSVLRQKDAPAYEIVVYDDGSTDSTAEIVRSYSAIDSRIWLVVGKENRGLSFSRTQLLANSSGKWILFLDADDSLESETLRRCFAATSSDADIIMMGSKIRSRRFGIAFRYFIPSKKFPAARLSTSDLRKKLLSKSGITVNVWDKMYSRDIIDRSNIVVEEKFYGEDLMFNTRVFANDLTISLIDYAGYRWTTDGGSWLDADSKWDEDINLAERSCRLLQSLGIDCNENRRAAVEGLENALALAVADKVSKSFPLIFRKKKILDWLGHALSDPRLDALSANLPDYSALRRRDADAIFARGRQMVRKSRLGFLLKRIM